MYAWGWDAFHQGALSLPIQVNNFEHSILQKGDNMGVRMVTNNRPTRPVLAHTQSPAAVMRGWREKTIRCLYTDGTCQCKELNSIQHFCVHMRVTVVTEVTTVVASFKVSWSIPFSSLSLTCCRRHIEGERENRQGHSCQITLHRCKQTHLHTYIYRKRVWSMHGM